MNGKYEVHMEQKMSRKIKKYILKSGISTPLSDIKSRFFRKMPKLSNEEIQKVEESFMKIYKVLNPLNSRNSQDTVEKLMS